MIGLRSALAGLVAAAAPLVALVAPGLVDGAAATTPGVGFTADPLPTYQTNGIAWSLAEANGVVYVGGTFSAVRPPGAAAGTSELPAANFVALDAATGNPTGCSLSFTGTSASVRALGVSPDRRTLYAAGRFSAVNDLPVQNLAAVDLRTCTPIRAFHPATSGRVRDLAVAAGGAVYLAGEFRTVEGKPRRHFAAVSPTGALLAWAPDADLDGYAVAVTHDGTAVAVGGAFDTVDGIASHALAIVSASTGQVVHSYPEDFVPVGSTVKALAADDSGIYSGNEGTGFRLFDGRLALDPHTFQERWRDTCLGATQDVHVDKRNLYAADHAHDCTTMGGFPNGRRQHLTVEGTNDPHMRVWWPDTNDGIGEGVGPRALDIVAKGGHRYLFAVGEFTTVNGVAQQGILRVADAPDTGAPSAPSGLSAGTSIAGRVQLRWLASADRDDEHLTYEVHRSGSRTPVARITASSDWWRRPQLSYVDTHVVPGTRYVYSVRASDGSGNTSAAPTLGVRPSSTSSRYASTVLADKPSLYWRYDERGGATLGDDSPVGNGGLVLGGRKPAVTPGALGKDPSTALRFDGDTGYAYQSERDPAVTAFTVETWFKTTSKHGGRLVGYGSNTMRLSGSFDRHVYLRDDGRLTFGVFSGGVQTLTSRLAYNDGRWHHVVGTQGAAGMALYVDGVRAATNGVTKVFDYLGYWRVGGDNLANWPARPTSDFFAGSLDETAVYHRQLSAARILAHFRASGRS